MPLYILVPMVVFGVSGMVLLIWLLRPTKPFFIDSPDDAVSVWNHFNHENEAVTAQVNDEGTHALITTKKGLGLLCAFGTDPLTRVIRKKAEIETNDRGIRLVTGDFTVPAIFIPLADPAQRELWFKTIRDR